MLGTARTRRPPGKQFPMGFWFNPTDERLMGNYLYKRLKGILKENEKAMFLEYNLYGKKEPWEIWEMFGGDRLPDSRGLYFFTRLKRKAAGKIIHRTVGNTEGLWRQMNRVDIEVWVKGEDNKIHCVKGSKRKFGYKNYTYPFSEQQGRWIMHEYTISGGSDLRESNDVVLCLLNKIDIPVAISTGQGNAEILATASSKRKLDAYENCMATNEELLGNVQKSMNLRCTNDARPPIAGTALIDGFHILGSSGQETTGLAGFSFSTADDDFSSDSSMDLNLSAEELLHLQRIFSPTASSNYPEPGYPTIGNWGQPEQPTMEQQPQCACTLTGNHPTPPPYYSNNPAQQPSWYQSNPSTLSQTPQQAGYDYYGKQPQVGSAAALSLSYSYSQTLPVAGCSYYDQGYSQQPPTYGQNVGQNVSNQFTTMEQQNPYALPTSGPPNVASQLYETFSSQSTQPASAYPPPAFTQPGANPQAYWSSSSFTGQLPVQSGYEQSFHSQTAYGGLQQSPVPSPTAQSIYGQGGYSLQPDPAPGNYVQGTHPLAYGQPRLETQQPPSQPPNIGLSQRFAYAPEAHDEHSNADNV